jgi:hypothetical protein
MSSALEAIGAEPDEGVDGWRWLIPSGGIRVRIEFLCDLEDQPEGVTVSLPGCARLRAANLRGTGFVARDWAEEPIERVVDGPAAAASDDEPNAEPEPALGGGAPSEASTSRRSRHCCRTCQQRADTKRTH